SLWPLGNPTKVARIILMPPNHVNHFFLIYYQLKKKAAAQQDSAAFTFHQLPADPGISRPDALAHPIIQLRHFTDFHSIHGWLYSLPALRREYRIFQWFSAAGTPILYCGTGPAIPLRP